MSNARNLARLLPNASGQLPDAAMSSGSVLQVVSTTSTTAQSINTQTFTEIASLTASITPSSTSSKILIIGVVRFTSLTNGANVVAQFRLRRDSTDICQGTGASGNMVNATASAIDNDNDTAEANVPFNYLDSPATASAISYKVMGATWAGGAGMMVNTPASPDGQFYNGYVTSTLTLMEIAG